MRRVTEKAAERHFDEGNWEAITGRIGTRRRYQDIRDTRTGRRFRIEYTGALQPVEQPAAGMAAIHVNVETDLLYRPTLVVLHCGDQSLRMAYDEALHLHDTLEGALNHDYAEAARLEGERVGSPSPAQKAAATKRAAGTDRLAARKAWATRKERIEA